MTSSRRRKKEEEENGGKTEMKGEELLSYTRNYCQWIS